MTSLHQLLDPANIVAIWAGLGGRLFLRSDIEKLKRKRATRESLQA